MTPAPLPMYREAVEVLRLAAANAWADAADGDGRTRGVGAGKSDSESHSTTDSKTHSRTHSKTDNDGRTASPCIERVPLGAAGGRVLATAITADRDLPPFNRAAMDGYAVRTADVTSGGGPATLRVLGDQPAGAPVPSAADLGDVAGACMRISTGAAVPSVFDAVVPHERTDRGDPVTIDAPDLSAGAAIHPRGADAGVGTILVAAGTQLGPVQLGLAATVGQTDVDVARRPRSAVLTTGRELRGPGEPVADHEIRNSNAPQLAGLLPQLGTDPDVPARHVDDDELATRNALAELAAHADIICTVGGISAGEHDHVAAAVESLGGRFVLRGAAIQPGKPIAAAVLPADGAAHGKDAASTLVICLPGNPVSALACAMLFAWPVIRDALGQTSPTPAGDALDGRDTGDVHDARDARDGRDAGDVHDGRDGRDVHDASTSAAAIGVADAPPGGDLPWTLRPLSAPARPNPRRTAFRPACSDFAGVRVPTWSGSGDLAHTATTDGLACLPRGTDELPIGTPVAFLPWPQPAESFRP